jgi:hypothetical protein
VWQFLCYYVPKQKALTREVSELRVGSNQNFNYHTDIHLSLKNINPHNTKLFAGKIDYLFLNT